MTKKVKNFRDNWKNAFIIFTIAWFCSYWVSSYGGEWEEEIKESASYKIQVVEDSPFNEYFYYYSVVFEKTWEDTATFSGSEVISYISNRVIYKIIYSLDFSEKIWRMEWNWILRNVSNLWDNRDYSSILDRNNYKYPHERKNFVWDLSNSSWTKVTCETLGKWLYKVEHNITAIVEYWIRKTQTPNLYTYFECK